MGSFIIDSHSSEESPRVFMEVNEEVDGGTIFATRLLARTIQAILGLSTMFHNCQCLHG